MHLCKNCGEPLEDDELKEFDELSPTDEAGWASDGPVKTPLGSTYCSQGCMAEKQGWAYM
jgi:hypothetical protein